MEASLPVAASKKLTDAFLTDDGKTSHDEPSRIREHMRQTEIQTTLRYAHLRPKHLDDVVEALDASAASVHNMVTSQAGSKGIAVSR